jgi:hypothetical protein
MLKRFKRWQHACDWPNAVTAYCASCYLENEQISRSRMSVRRFTDSTSAVKCETYVLEAP